MTCRKAEKMSEGAVQPNNTNRSPRYGGHGQKRTRSRRKAKGERVSMVASGGGRKASISKESIGARGERKRRGRERRAKKGDRQVSNDTGRLIPNPREQWG